MLTGSATTEEQGDDASGKVPQLCCHVMEGGRNLYLRIVNPKPLALFQQLSTTDVVRNIGGKSFKSFQFRVIETFYSVTYRSWKINSFYG